MLTFWFSHSAFGMLEIISVDHILSNFELGEKEKADKIPRTSNYHFVKLLATAIATFLQETVNAYGNLRSAYNLRPEYGTNF